MDSINNFTFKWLNREVKIKIIKECPEIQLLTKKIGPFKKETELKIEYWIAKILQEEEYATLLEPVEYDIEELLKIQWSEQEKSKIQKIEKFFYLKTQEAILNLLNELKNQDNFTINTQKLQKKEKMMTIFKDIFSRRLYKILRIASMGSKQSQFINHFTDEELELYLQLRKIIKDWMNEFVEISNKTL